ncbi:hypothetical protein Aperf_G00000027210 [Anoplocephala perfoliata]
MVLEESANIDDSLMWQLQNAFSQNISFSKNLVVTGIISYSADGSTEKFVKINFSLDSQVNSNGANSPTDSPNGSASAFSGETKASECASSSASPPILSKYGSGLRAGERRGRRKSNKPRRQPLQGNENPSNHSVEFTELGWIDKSEDKCIPSKKAKRAEPDESQQTPNESVQPFAFQALLSSLVGASLTLDNQRNTNTNPFVTNLSYGLPLGDQSLLQRLTANSQGSFSLTDLMFKQNLQSSGLSTDQSASGLLAAICETPGQPPKNVLIPKSVAAAFASAAATQSNAGNLGSQPLQPSHPSQQQVDAVQEETLHSDPNAVSSNPALCDTPTSIANGSINLLRCNTLPQSIGAPISINLPITTSATLQPTLTVIGSLPNSLATSIPATILSIGNANGRNIPPPSNASAITALLRGLTRSKPVSTSAVDSSASKIITSPTSEPSVVTSSADTKPVTESLAAHQLPVDLNSLAAAVAAVTGNLTRNPTISPGPLPGSILLSCPKIVPSSDQPSPILNVINQKTSENPFLTPSSGAMVAESVKSEPPSKDSQDSTIDRILENIRGQLRASEAEKATKASLVASSNCVRKVKVNEPKSSSLISQSSGVRIQIPLKKGNGKLAPVAPSPVSRTGSSTSVSLQNATATMGSSAEVSHKDYKCRYCGKNFNRKFCRERHERLHTGVKPYKCEICEETFIRLEDKKRHVRSILHTSRVAAAQASGRSIPASLDPQGGGVSEGDASPTSEHTFSMEDPPADAQIDADSPENQQASTSPSPPSPPTQATFKHFRRSELKHTSTPVRRPSSEDGEQSS